MFNHRYITCAVCCYWCCSDSATSSRGYNYSCYLGCCHVKRHIYGDKYQSTIWHSCLIHWGRDNMAAIFQTTFSFSGMKMCEFRLNFHWSLFPRVQSTMMYHWFRCWFGAKQTPSHYLKQGWSSLLTHICIIRTQCDDSLISGCAYMQRWTNLSLVQINFCRRFGVKP